MEIEVLGSCNSLRRGGTVSIRRALVLGAMVTTLTGAAAASEASGQELIAGQRTVRASGTGEVRVQPDQATLQFAVETTGATAQEAAQSNADAMDRVIRALVNAGIPRADIRTSGYSLSPIYTVPSRDPQTEPPAIRGYRASNQVSVRSTDLAALGQLIDIGLEAGANRLNGIFFEVRDSAAAEAEALARAVASARRSAETIASALGVRLGAVLDASTMAEPVRPFFRPAAMESDIQFRAVTPIEPGEQTVTATATVVFAIE